MTNPTETATTEPTIVTVFEHHDTDGANLDVAVVRPRRWQFLTVEAAARRESSQAGLPGARGGARPARRTDDPLLSR
jgi:hypothetical protein